MCQTFPNGERLETAIKNIFKNAQKDQKSEIK
jgi:hypothetical protein